MEFPEKCQKCKYLYPNKPNVDYYRCHMGRCPALIESNMINTVWIIDDKDDGIDYEKLRKEDVRKTKRI